MSDPSRKFPIGLTIASVIGIAILIGLGVWQVKRLHWKEALLAKIAAFEAAAWYWHFVDVVWLVLFAFLYGILPGIK